MLKELGAQRCEIETPDLSKHLPGSTKIDAVLDLVGNTTFMDSLKILHRGGRMCLAGWLGFNQLPPRIAQIEVTESDLNLIAPAFYFI